MLYIINIALKFSACFPPIIFRDVIMHDLNLVEHETWEGSPVSFSIVETSHTVLTMHTMHTHCICAYVCARISRKSTVNGSFAGFLPTHR